MAGGAADNMAAMATRSSASPAADAPVPDESVSGGEFRAALSRWASGVTVVTATGPHGPTGMTVSSFASLSLDPPLVLACIARSSGSHDALVLAEGFGVHVLSQDQRDLSARFARPGIDKFAGLDHEVGPYGAPLLPVGLARLVCARQAVLDGGDHTILVGRVTRAEIPELDDLGDPLLHYNRGYRALTDPAD
jgi:flavin reductase (DIM6/NTAB) family NADH-FMN oxidoreductase RutF